MKYVIIIVFLVSLFSVSALTKETVLVPNQSFNFSDKNVTLIAIGEDNIVVCVNNKKGILEDGEFLNDVEFQINNIQINYVELTLKTGCDNCVCDENCNNNLCFASVIEEEVLEENITEVECISDDDCNDNNVNTLYKCENNKCVYGYSVDGNFEDKGIIVGEEKKANPVVYLSLFLFLLLVLILVIFLLKKR